MVYDEIMRPRRGEAIHFRLPSKVKFQKQLTLDGDNIAVPQYSDEGCECCNAVTKHEILSLPYPNGNGGDLRCTICDSYRMWKIQGMDAQLM